MVRLLIALGIATLLALPARSLLAQQPVPPVRPALLAEIKDVRVPAGAYWAMSELTLRAGQEVTHEQGLEFVYALQGEAEVAFAGQTVRIEQGKAAAIPAGVRRTYRGNGRIVSFVLAPPAASWGEVEVARSGRTGPLAGIRPGPQMARLVRVALSPGAQTPVHTHPGPELVYAPETPVILQTEGQLRWVMGRDLALLPGDVPLQVRNISAGEAWFLALFIVADGAPFQTNLPGFQHAPHPGPHP
jgi:quercetin dioxygenase-like cupin family protein